MDTFAAIRSDNTSKGKIFQLAVKELLEKLYNKEFLLECPVNIGVPPKAHKFDIVSSDKTVVVECKCYSWTSGGNNPSAKLSTANEALLYMSFLLDNCEKLLFICHTDKMHRKEESLEQYYVRTYGSFLRDVKVMEYDMETQQLLPLKGKLNCSNYG